jgi:deaminated glutathione amidase
MRVAVVQLNSRDDKEANLATAEHFIDQAAAAGAQLVALPEYFSFLGPEEAFADNAEPIPGPTIDRLRERARRHNIYLHCGSIIEKSEHPGKIFNTSVILSPDGQIICRYRKVHMYDVNLGDNLVYSESAVIEPGREITTCQLGDLHVGLAICYDLRFPELFRILALRGAQTFVLPAAFTVATGRDHWEVLLRARAIENQAYVIAPAQIGEHPVAKYCYGRSMIIDPWGVVVAKAPDVVSTVCAEIDIGRINRIRLELPSLKNRRPEAYRWE